MDGAGGRVAGKRHRRPHDVSSGDRRRQAAHARVVRRSRSSKDLVGFGHKQAGCSACADPHRHHAFGLATILQGPWITGNKFYAGSGAEVAYLPAKKIAIAVITTYLPSAFDSQGNVKDVGPAIAASLSQAVAPDSPIPS